MLTHHFAAFQPTARRTPRQFPFFGQIYSQPDSPAEGTGATLLQKDSVDSDEMGFAIFPFLSNKASTMHKGMQGYGVFQDPTSMKCCPKCANDESPRTGWHRMIEGTHTGQPCVACSGAFASRLQEHEFLSEKTLFPANMTTSIASEVAEVKRTQEFKVVVFNKIAMEIADMLCVAVWLRVKGAASAHGKQCRVQTHSKHKSSHSVFFATHAV